MGRHLIIRAKRATTIWRFLAAFVIVLLAACLRPGAASVRSPTVVATGTVFQQHTETPESGLEPADAPVPTPYVTLTTSRERLLFDTTVFPYTVSNVRIPTGRATSVTFSPAFEADGTAFAVIGGTLYKTSDGGTAWRVVDSRVRNVALSPAFDTDGVAYSLVPGVGVRVSRDFGETWRTVSGSDTGAEAITLSPDYARDHTLFARGEDLHWSADEVETWAKSEFVPPSPFDPWLVEDVAFAADYGSSGRVYMVLQRRLFESTDRGVRFYQVELPFSVSRVHATDAKLYVLNDEALYASDDAGATWSLLADADGGGFRDFAVVDNSGKTRIVLATEAGGILLLDDSGATWLVAVVPSEGADVSRLWTSGRGSVALGAQPTTGDGVFWLSRDAGASWEAVGGIETAALAYLAVSPDAGRDGTVATVASGGVAISRDMGKSWTLTASVSVGFADPSPTSVAFSPYFAEDRTVYAGGGWGVAKSEDGGATWRVVYGRATVQVIETVETPEGVTLLAAIARGLVYSSDGGETWEVLAASPQAVHDVAFSPNFVQDATIFAGTFEQEFYRSTDAYGSQSRILRSLDGGQSWHVVVQGKAFAPPTIVVSADYAEDATVWVAGPDGGALMRSRSRGTFWERVGDGAVGGSIAECRDNMQAALVSFTGAVSAGGSGASAFTYFNQPAFSLDGGDTWKLVPVSPLLTGAVVGCRLSGDLTILAGGGYYGTEAYRLVVDLP
ncbi:MAG: hypothetical protein FJ312_04065 [SAR202 cluster bacterium]|nr:hypothetical protein [SAR202 cluster bacterium]